MAVFVHGEFFLVGALTIGAVLFCSYIGGPSTMASRALLKMDIGLDAGILLWALLSPYIRSMSLWPASSCGVDCWQSCAQKNNINSHAC